MRWQLTFFACAGSTNPLLCSVFTDTNFNETKTMSQHPSFKKGAAGALKKRSVLKRFERVDLLRKRGQWKEGDRVLGLRKTRPEE